MLQRIAVPSLDEILGVSLKVLDHGFIRVVDYMGSDCSVVQSARVSYGRGTKTSLEDKGLINYLLRKSHTTPFESATIKLHVKCPIFVARHWHRHRTQSYNEYSARYSLAVDEYYIPEDWRLSVQSQTNKQGGDIPCDEEVASQIRNNMITVCEIANQYYGEFISKHSLARELARIVLPQSMYTEFYTSINLYNLLHFLKLRADDHAQWEIRQYAKLMMAILKRWCPITHDAFMNYEFEARKISRDVLALLKAKLKGENITQENSRLTKREWNEVRDLLE